MENWKKYIFENNEKTLFETDSIQELHCFLDEFDEEMIFRSVYETPSFMIIDFIGFHLMIKK